MKSSRHPGRRLASASRASHRSRWISNNPVPPPSLLRAAATVVESLETRQLLSVSLNPAGWTVVTPAANTRMVYVDNVGGSDANAGLSSASPVATIQHGLSLLRNGFADWLLLKRGDTFGTSVSFGYSGQDAQDPFVITNYGDSTQPRPVIDSGYNTAFRMGSNNSFLDIIGISFTTSTHNPSSPNYNGQGSYGFYDLGGTNNLLIEDCSFSYFVNDISFQGYYAPLSNITLRRNEILDSYNTNGHSQGLYAETVNGLTLDGNYFDHDGWNSNVVGAQPTIYNHDAYLHSSDSNVVVVNNIFAEAGSFGLEARAGGIVDNNLFLDNPYGFSFGLVNGSTTHPGGVSGQVVGNVVLGTRQDPSGWGIGGMIGNLAVGGGTVVSNNIITGNPNSTNPALQFEPGVAVANPTQEAGLNTLTVSNNVIYKAGFGLSISAAYVPGTAGPDGLTAVVIKNNDFQANTAGRIVQHGDLYDPRFEDWSGNVYSSTTAPTSNWFSLQGVVTSLANWQANVEPTALNQAIPFADPSRTLGGFMAAQGLAATDAAFIAGIRQQNSQNWNPLYLASAVNSYIQGGFIVDSNAPAASLVGPPDVTSSTYQANPTPTFTITYTDAVAIDPATLGSANVSITGPGGATLAATLVSTTGSGASITATYQIAAPSNDWTTSVPGTYVISLVGGQVGDTAGNFAPGQALGSFQVSVSADPTPPTAPATTPAALTATTSGNSIVLSFSDPAGDQRGYILQRAVDPGFTQQVQNDPIIATATSYTDSTAVVGQTYYYQLIATNPIGNSAPTPAVSAVILPNPPVLNRVILDDGNTQRTAVTNATLVYSQPVSVSSSDVTLIQNPAGSATPINVVVNNPTGDGKLWVLSWTTGQFNNALPDGSYSLSVNNALVTDAFGQAAGTSTSTTNFTSAVGPVVTSIALSNLAPPAALSYTFSQDVSASLSVSSLVLTNSAKQTVAAASYAWNPGTLTATWTFAGALPDTGYTARLPAASVTNAFGDHLDGNGDGLSGDDSLYYFTQFKPTLSATGAVNVNLGGPYTLTLGAINDPGQTAPSYVVHWGDGNTTNVKSPGALTYTYSSGTGPTTITVDVVDANGVHTACATKTISVNRATIGLSGNTNANPGAPYSLTLGAVTDTGFTPSSYIIHWGDGATTNTAAVGTFTHAYSNTGRSAIGDAITVDIVDNSGVGGASFTNVSAGSLPVTVNLTPSIPLGGELNANVNGTYRLLLGNPSDPGFTVSGLSVNWGDGSAPQSIPVGTTLVAHTFQTATAPQSDTLTVQITDNSGVFTSPIVQSVIVNPSPTVALAGNANANVGGTYLLTVGPATDAGQATPTYLVHWGDGTTSQAAGLSVVPHVYATPGPETITADLTDGTGTFVNAGSFAVTVNTAPTIALSGLAYANANGVYTLNLGAVSDPGQTVSQYAVHWGDGTTTAYTAGGPVTHTYAGPGMASISVDLTDGTGTYAATGALPPLTIAQPGVTLSGHAGVFSGVPYSLTINPPSDVAGTPSGYVIHWGDGSTSTASAPGVLTHTYAVAQQVVITADLQDNTGTFPAAGTLSLTVAPPPTLTLPDRANTNVGGTFTLPLGSVSDAIGTPTAFIVHWGDGASATYAAGAPITHVYTTAGAVTAVVDVVDQNGIYAAADSLAITVNQPTLTLQGAANAPLGQPYTLTLASAFDPGQTIGGVVVHWGDGQTTAGPYSAGTALQHTYAAAGPATITVDLTDGIGTYAAAGSLPILVSAPPVVTLAGNANANLGGVYTINIASVADSNGTPTAFKIRWGDGTGHLYLGTTTASIHRYSTVGPKTIGIDVYDPAGFWANAGAFNLTVNPAPTIALAGNPNANVGGSYSLNLGAVTDPGYTVSQYTVNWGDGQSSVYTAGGVVTHTFAATGADTISVDLSDSTGSYTANGTLAVTVNPAPVVALAGNANANAGGTYSLNLGAVTDPGYTVSQYTVKWGDGQSSAYTAGGLVTHTFASTGTDTISVDLTDPTGVYTAAGVLPVTVNPAPTIAVTGSANANVGGAYSLNLGAVTDPGYAVSQYTVNWGDGQSSAYATAGTVTHTFTASAPSDTITVGLTDSTGVYAAAASLNVAVNPAPAALISGNAYANVGGVYNLSLDGNTDVGYTPSQYIVHWGDGQTSTYPPTASGNIQTAALTVLAHTYAATGHDTITVDLVDPTGPYTATAKLAVTVDPPPSLALAGNANANVGGVYTLNLGTPTDPGYAVSQYTVHWGDGTNGVYSAPGAVTHTYAATGVQNIAVDLTDATGTYASAGTLTTTVKAAPTIALSGNAAASPNVPYALTLGAVSDPGYAVAQYIVHWGDGSSATYTAGGVVNHTYATPGKASITVDLVDATGTYAGAGSLNLTVGSAVVGRYVFYNDSSYNGYQTAPATADFAAIATDKSALLPGQAATFANYTSYTKGINGVILDMTGLPAGATLGAADFAFAAGNTANPATWSAAPAPTGIAIFRGAGVGGSDRIVLTFADNAIVGQWLRVSVLATANTALAAPDVFYFGNAPGDTGNSPTDAIVNAADFTAALQNESVAPAAITSLYDFNRDRTVNTVDALIARSDATTSTTALELLVAP